jgi:small subunit ribosomal protein S11
MAAKPNKSKKKSVQVASEGIAHINVSLNNIIVTITNPSGDTVAWASAGKMGFRGAKKSTPYAAQITALDCANFAFSQGMRKLNVRVKGPGAGREMAIRALGEAGFKVEEIKDITPIPHNGCRPPK